MSTVDLYRLVHVDLPDWLWLSAILVFTGYYYRLKRRLDNHAQSIGYVDQWADLVDEELTELGRRVMPMNDNAPDEKGRDNQQRAMTVEAVSQALAQIRRSSDFSRSA
jgi:hypothetical protein